MFDQRVAMFLDRTAAILKLIFQTVTFSLFVTTHARVDRCPELLMEGLRHSIGDPREDRTDEIVCVVGSRRGVATDARSLAKQAWPW
jgi:hypothetical protein